MDKIRTDFPEIQKAKEELEKIFHSPDERVLQIQGEKGIIS